jgi:hypothetical protein
MDCIVVFHACAQSDTVMCVLRCAVDHGPGAKVLLERFVGPLARLAAFVLRYWHHLQSIRSGTLMASPLVHILTWQLPYQTRMFTADVATLGCRSARAR